MQEINRTNKQLIAEIINQNRPNLNVKSLNAYVSTLVNIPIKMNVKITDPSFFERNQKQIIDFLNTIPLNSKKMALSALVVLTDGDKIYKEEMHSSLGKSKEIDVKQEKSQSQKDNWIEWEDVMEVYSKLQKKAEANIKSKDYDLELLSDYILLSMFVLLPPRRAMDYSTMKIRNYDVKNDNYIDVTKNAKISYADYKTKKTYGIQEFDISGNTQLMKIIKKWKTINTGSDYLLLEAKNSTEIMRQFNAIFKKTDRKVSVNILRHSYLTNFYGEMTGMPSIKIMTDMASRLGHSVEQQLLYIKKD